MRGISNAVLSLTAMALSSLTTYLTFFDARYTLTEAIADVTIQVQSGGSSSGDRIEGFYRYFPTYNIILSNRGTRPIVVSDLDMLRVEEDGSCADAVADEKIFVPTFETIIVEPGTVRPFKLETALPSIDRETTVGIPFDLTGETAKWCFEWTLFDPNGRRHQPRSVALTTDITFTGPEPGDTAPDTNIDFDYPKRPDRLISRGLF